MEMVEKVERKNWIDNLRWITIVIVVVFHMFYYYNNIGTVPMFLRLEPNPLTEGAKASITFAGFVQYFVYQWFMILLFVVSGICAKYTLQKKSIREFLKNRIQKILVPSTLGVITIQWIGGWLISNLFIPEQEVQKIPGIVKYIISVFSGIGALWFCHILFVACLILALIKKIDKNCRLETLGEKSNIVIALFSTIIMIGAAKLLSVKMIPTYRMCYYPMGFLFGYYVFSSEKLLSQLKKWGWIFLAAGLLLEIPYFMNFYGQPYSNLEVQNNPLTVTHAWFMVIGILGVAQNLLNFENGFSRFMCRESWGIYINHITLMIILNMLLKRVAQNLPVAAIYLIELIVTFPASIGCYELFRRIPVLRYVLYGIKGKK